VTLVSDQTALLVARCGAGRCGASRCGFTPRDTKNAAGNAPGPFYRWAMRLMSAVSWTKVRD